MSDKEGNAKTATTPHQVRGRLWQDNHSELRRHKLMTKELAEPSRPCTPMTARTTPTPLSPG